MQSHKSVALVILIVLVLSVAAPAPVAASTISERLPPLPEWPIVGPLLRRLGVVEEASPPATPDPSLPEYRITDFEDLNDLQEIEVGERVRLVVSDDDLNRMAARVIRENVGEEASSAFEFDPDEVTVWIEADEELLDRSGVDVPNQIRGDVDLTATMSAGADDCVPYVEIRKLRVNRWSFGLRSVAQRAINNRIPEVWPEELCVETIILSDDEVAVEGYQRP